MASTPDALRLEVQERLTRPDLFRAYVYAAVALAIVGLLVLPGFGVVLTVALIIGGFFVRDRALEWRTARVIYDLDSEEVVLRTALANEVGEALGGASALWHISHSVETSDGRRNAGADRLIQRTAIRVATMTLPGIELNVEPRSIPVGPQKLLFLPDRLLIWDGRQLAAVAYEGLSVDAHPKRFVEEERVPRDARQVGTTWRFVRNDGGPDLRFNNNAELPVLEYGEVEVRSESGMCIVLQTSTLSAAVGASTAIARLARSTTPERSVPQHKPVAVAQPALVPIKTPQAPEPAPLSLAPAAGSPTQGLTEDEVLAFSVATLLRYIAAADRRLDQVEVDYARQVLGQLSPDAAKLADAFRGLPSDILAIDSAIHVIRERDAFRQQWLLQALEGMAKVDGKATPKEIERLDEIRYELRAETDLG